MRCLLICCLILPALHASAAGGQAASTAPYQSPLFLVISKDSDSSSIGLDYRIRWDFSDLASFKPGFGLIYSGIRAAARWDITENTRLEYYGFRTNPWRLVIAREKKGSASGGGETAPAEGGARSEVISRPTPEYRKRLRLSISPLVDDIKRNFDEGLRDYLLKSSLKGVSPEWEKTSKENKRAFFRDVLSIGIWNSAPVLKEAGEGLEYISEKRSTGTVKKGGAR